MSNSIEQLPEIDVVFRYDDLALFAIAELDEDGRILFSNKKFDEFFDSPKDAVRIDVHPETVMFTFLHKARSETGDEPEAKAPKKIDKNVGATDRFYHWGMGNGDEAAFEVRYQLPKKIRFRSPDRDFHFWLRKRSASSEGYGTYTLFLENITSQRRDIMDIKRTTEALSGRLSELMVEGSTAARHSSMPGLSYHIDPVRGGVGGDFVFDWSVRRTTRVKRRLRITMVGDAEAQGTVGGLMAASLGYMLKATCLKPREVLGDLGKGANLAEAVAGYLNNEIIDHNATGSRGVDGMMIVTDLSNRHVYMAEGKFQAFILKPSAKTSDDIISFGDMTSGGPKAFGETPDAEFNSERFAFSKNTLVVAFSDGASDLLANKSFASSDDEMKSFLLEKLGEAIKAAGKVDFPELVPEFALALRSAVHCQPEGCDGDPPELVPARDDTVVFVLAPFHREWIDYEKRAHDAD